MVLGDGVAEKHVEPVGVSVLSLAQIGVACLEGVGERILAGSRVVGVHELVHLTIDTTVGSTVGVGEVEVAGTFHFAVYTHLLL